MNRLFAGLCAVGLAGCGFGGVDCADPANILAKAGEQSLTCEQGEALVDYLEALGARPLTPALHRTARETLAARFAADPDGTNRVLVDSVRATEELRALRGPAGAERASTLAWEAVNGKGPVPEAGFGNLVASVLSIWARDDAERLVLTEMDIEGWIRYASLCREVQGATPLRLSIADRATTYRMLVDKFDAADRSGQLALVALGPYWLDAADRWKIASYGEQQAWIQRAPLPPPMEATSLGYVEALLAMDLGRHAAVFLDTIGSPQ